MRITDDTSSGHADDPPWQPATPASLSTPDHVVADAPSLGLVLLGSDVGCYSLARAFHQRYGISAVAINPVATAGIKNSKIIRTVETGAGATREDTLAALEAQGKAHRARGVQPVLMSNTDEFSRMFSEKYEWLSQWYRMPTVDMSVLDQINDKGRFAALCEELDIPHPSSVVLDLSGADGQVPQAPDLPFDYPIIAKAAVGALWHKMSFPGKRKIYKIADRAELQALIATLVKVGYRDSFVLQDLIPGDDTAIRLLTAYVDQHGEVTLMATAQVLLQDHRPREIGNPISMVTTSYPELFDPAKVLLKRLGYRGFANIDLKFDARDDSVKFLEVNPRVGRSNFFVTAAGGDLAGAVVDDVVHQRRRVPDVTTREVLCTHVPRPVLKRYVDREMWSRLQQFPAEEIIHPLDYPETRWRRAYRQLAQLSHILRLARFYPRPTKTGL